MHGPTMLTGMPYSRIFPCPLLFSVGVFLLLERYFKPVVYILVLCPHHDGTWLAIFVDFSKIVSYLYRITDNMKLFAILFMAVFAAFVVADPIQANDQSQDKNQDVYP